MIVYVFLINLNMNDSSLSYRSHDHHPQYNTIYLSNAHVITSATTEHANYCLLPSGVDDTTVDDRWIYRSRHH